ncbi:MAG: uracil-DNA glycosylase [Bacteroidota bacterium]
MGNTAVKIEESWKEALQMEFNQPYFSALIQFLKNEKAKGKTIYPPGSLIFNAFDTSPLSSLKVVILGQDPYIKPNQAMGLSFSVPKGIGTPPSLKNIYKELHTDLGIPIANHGDLTAWAKQGVFLLNAALTVEAGKSGSHLKKGWGQFTDAVIRLISNERNNIVFMLWGNFAKAKSALIDPQKHLILQAAHPSPLAGGAFFGNKHFSQANAYLEQHGRTPIDWSL